MNDPSLVDDIIRRFQLPGDRYTSAAFGTGHINDTFLIRNRQADQYLLQCINRQVYRDVAGLMRNLRRVTEHLRQKIASARTPTSLTTFDVILTHDGAGFYQDSSSNYWRVLTFIDHSVAYDVADSPKQAEEAGQAFGQFLALLRDLPGEPLTETIPAFHAMSSRLDQFRQVLTADAVGRAAQVPREIDFAHRRADEMRALHQRVATGQIPTRVAHNDTKLSNVLLDRRTGQARCVVDLDTVMPGTVLYDFGDAVRSLATTAPEDEVDLDNVRLHLPFYEAFARGYLGETRTFLTEAEIAELSFSARYMTFIMGLRFLTDYLAGDVYYKTQHPEHNLVRSRNQFQLIRRMEAQYDEMVRIINVVARPR